MNKRKLFALISIFSAIPVTLACYKSPKADYNLANQTPYPSTPAPRAEVSPSTSTSTSDRTTASKVPDFSDAMSDYNSKNYAKAVTGFQEIIRANPQHSMAHFYLGKSYQGLKKDDDAIPAFKQALSVKPDYPEASFSLGIIYYGRKNYETSLPYFEQAAKINYKSTDMLYALAENQRVLKQFDRAIVQYGKIIGFEPNNANAYYGLGMTYIGLNNKIGARQQLQKLEPLNKDLAKRLSAQIPG